MVTQKDFEKHLQESPHIYELFEKFALEAAKYRKKFSSQAILERIRWETFAYDNNSRYKISHNWRSFYAKKFMDEHPEYGNFFTSRSKKRDNEQ